ncbi:MAG: short-chain fatty acid transporter [Flavobacteriales bacterium]
MSFSDKYSKVFKYLLPSPFTIAVILSIITFFIALIFTNSSNQSVISYSFDLLKYWEEGIWNSSLLVFAMQMMLMLVLGHVLALSKPIDNLISLLVKQCTSTAKSATLVTLLTVIVSLFNWGLGLIFGAIFARKIGEYAQKNNLKINYPLIGAAGYSGLMVWHGGLSGSSLSKVAESNHLKEMMNGLLSVEQIESLPERISYWDTVGSSMNLTIIFLVITILPLAMYFIGKKSTNQLVELSKNSTTVLNHRIYSGAEKLDYSKIFSLLFGLVLLVFIAHKIAIDYQFNFLDFFTPNNINLLLFCFALLFHSNFNSFLSAVDEAIVGVSGILIQFPLYFGIMGIMKGSGLVTDISDFFIAISNDFTFYIYTFLSAGLVNIFVPSGGGQWAVQGPIIIQSALELGVSIPKSILALAYGDQLTNMLQPFWALPLLGITGLKAKQILPYTLILMLLGGLIFISCLIIF